MADLYRIDDRQLLAAVLDGRGVFLDPASVLDGLTSEQVSLRPHGLPHSIAEIVAHMAYWQEFFNGCAVTGFTGIASHAAEGWPDVSGQPWDEVRGRFLTAVAEAGRVAGQATNLADALLPPGVPIPPLAQESYGSGILHGAVHSAHHLGQIITLRQLIGAWPPPFGPLTW